MNDFLETVKKISQFSVDGFLKMLYAALIKKYEHFCSICARYVKYDRAILYILTLICHIIFIYGNFRIMSVFPDETNTLALPSYLAGETISAGRSTMYHSWVTGILYTPFFMIFGSGYDIYPAILILNSAIMSFIPIIAYSTMKKHLGYEKRRGLFFISLAAGILPEHIYMSKFAWNETMVMLLSWVILYVLLETLNAEGKKKQYVSSGVLGLLLAAGTAAHGRMLAVLPAVVFAAVFSCAAYKNRSIKLAALLPSYILFSATDNIIKQFTIKNILTVNMPSDEPLRNTVADTLNNMIEAAGSPNILENSIRALNNYAFYDIFVSYGLILAMSLMLPKLFASFKTYESKEKKNELTVFLYCFSALVMLIAVTFLYLANTYDDNVLEAYYFISGRYTENIAAVFMIYSLYYIIRYGIKLKTVIISGIIMGVMSSAFFLNEAEILAGRGSFIEEIHFLTLYCQDLFDRSLYMGTFTSITMLISMWMVCVILLLLLKKKLKFMAMLCIFFLIANNLYSGKLYFNSRGASPDKDKIYTFLDENDLLYNKKIYFSSRKYILEIPNKFKECTNFLYYKADKEIIDLGKELEDGRYLISGYIPDDSILVLPVKNLKLDLNLDDLYFVILDEQDEELYSEEITPKDMRGMESFIESVTDREYNGGVFVCGDNLAQSLEQKGFKLSKDIPKIFR